MRSSSTCSQGEKKRALNSSHSARVGTKSADYVLFTGFITKTRTASSLPLVLLSLLRRPCGLSAFCGEKKPLCTFARGDGFRQIVALEHVRRRLFCLLAASVRAPDKTGHPFCGLKSQTAKAERFEDGSRTWSRLEYQRRGKSLALLYVVLGKSRQCWFYRPQYER